MPCSLLEMNRRFGGILCLYLEGTRVNETRNRYDTGNKQSFRHVQDGGTLHYHVRENLKVLSLSSMI
jgi:hypothetical protein